MQMEGEEPVERRTRSSKKTGKADVLPIAKRKRAKKSSPSARSPRRRRSTKSRNGDSAETCADTCNVDLKQGSWSSGWSISDDEELPPAALSSPLKDSQTQTYKKFDIVWIKYRREEYRPCLITSVRKKHVLFKFINTSRKYTFRAGIHKVIPFDDPVRNTELLKKGRKVCPDIEDAFDRVKHYYCRLSEQKDLSPLKYLFYDKTEDLLYGIIPESEVQINENKDAENEDALVEDEFDGPVFENSDDDDENNENKEEESNEHVHNENGEINKSEEENDIYKKMSTEEKAKLTENIKIILRVIESEDCFTHLKNIVEGSVKSFRMELLNEHKELELQYKSGGLGPFNGAEKSETDQLFHILDNLVERLQFNGDSSLLLRNVLLPEAIIFALQREWKWQNEEAETFYNEWTFAIPDWKEREC